MKMIWTKIKSWMFKGEIQDTFGEVKCLKNWIINAKIKVHKIKSNKHAGETYVGLEIIHTSAMSFQMTPLSLTRAEAEKLKVLIDKALTESH